MLSKSFLLYSFKLYSLSLATLLIARFCFAFIHANALVSLTDSNLIHSFLVGTFMDSVVTASLLFCIYLPFALVEIVTKRNQSFHFYRLSSFFLCLVFFINAIDIFYYTQYGTRLNMMVSEGVQRYSIIFSLIWKSYPVIPLLLVYSFGVFVFLHLHKRLFKSLDKAQQRNPIFIAWNCLMFFALSFMYYGPPFWYLTSFSSSTVANQMASNGVYTFVKAIDQKNIFDRDIAAYEFNSVQSALNGLKEKVIKPDEKSDSEYYPTLRHFLAPIPFNKKNVVIILLESFAARNVGCLGGKNISPHFDHYAQQGILFTDCFASGVRTQHGLTAVVGSFPPLLGNSLIRRKGFIEFSTLGNIFQNAGYQTQFFHNGHNGFGDTDFFLKQGGFENLTDEKDFTNWKFRNELGVCDEDLYEKVYPEIWSKKDVPKLSLILTMSNHAPHEIPNDFKATHPEIKNWDKKEAAFYYSDYALGKFLDQCAQHSEFKNTLFLLLADHGEIYDETDHGYKLFHIPALLLNSSRGKGTFASTCSQIDFAPTLLSEIGFHGSFNCLGQNLFDPDYLPFAFSKDYESKITLTRDTLIMQWDMRTQTPEFFGVDKTKHAHYIPDVLPATKKEMKQFTENYLQAISYIYRNGRFRLSEKF